MISVLLGFVFFLLAIFLGIQLNEDPGYVLIAINHWTIETTLWVSLITLLCLFLVLHMALLIIHRVQQVPKNYHQWRLKKRTQKAQTITRQGLIEFSEGHWSAAKNRLIKALPDTDTPLFNYLTAARAAQELGENQLRDDFLREAQQSVPDAKIAVKLTQAQLQLANQQWEQALATLRHLQELAPHHPYVLKLLTHLYQDVRDWPQLIALLPELKKYAVFSADKFFVIRHQTYLQFMIDLSKLEQSDALYQLANKLPKDLKADPELMACFSTFLIKNQELELAERTLSRCLRKTFNESLITIYGQFYCNEKQLFFAESLAKKYPNSASLYLCLGRLSLASHLWGKAKTYLEKSIQLNPQPSAYATMGNLLQRFNKVEEACEAYRQGLELAEALQNTHTITTLSDTQINPTNKSSNQEE